MDQTRPKDEVLPGLERPASRHGRITAVSMMKDEGPYVLEWVAHHLAVGFTDFVVYTNDCSDGTDDMLKRLQALGLVEHRVNRIPKGKKPQPSAIRYAQEEPAVASADWVMVFDADEFLCIRHGDGTLDGVIDAMEAQGANGLVVTWRIFGSAGIRTWSPRPVSEAFTRAAPPEWNKGWGVKTLFRHDPDIWKLGIHRPKIKNKVLDTEFPQTVHWLNGSGHPMEGYFRFRGWRSIVRTVGFDWAQMNHYAVKSAEAYAIRRLRGNVNSKADKYNADYWALQNRNEVTDEAALRHRDTRARIMKALLQDAELRKLHEAAVAGVEARLSEIRETPAYAELMAGLEEASKIPINEVSATPPKLRDPKEIAAKVAAAEARAGIRNPSPMPAPDDFPFAPAFYTRLPLPRDSMPDVEWHMNHNVWLPADPSLFTPLSLGLLKEGKFQRGLARHLPSIAVRYAPYLEIGAASGFLGLTVERRTQTCPVTMIETDPGWFSALNLVAERDGVGRSEIFGPGTDPVELVERVAPGTLVLGDPRIGPDLLKAVLDASPGRIGVVMIVGRLLTVAAPRMPGFSSVLKAYGLTGRIRIDPMVAYVAEHPA